MSNESTFPRPLLYILRCLGRKKGRKEEIKEGEWGGRKVELLDIGYAFSQNRRHTAAGGMLFTLLLTYNTRYRM